MSNIAPVNQKPLTPNSIPQPTGGVSSPPPPAKKIERKDPGKKKVKWNYIIGGIILLMLVVGGGAGFWLTKQSQDIRQQASEAYPSPTTPGSCSSASAANCQGGDPGDSCGGDGTCRELPNQKGADGKSKCTCDRPDDPSPTPSPSISPSPTPDPSVSPSPTPSPSPSVSPSPTPDPSESPSPTPDPSVSPSPSASTGTTTYACNSNCSSNSQCQGTNSNYICWLGQCRLDSNPTSDQCASSTSTTTQPDLPAQLPESGSEDVLNWLKAGFGVLGIGTVLLLLL